jgi:hypothetical protein
VQPLDYDLANRLSLKGNYWVYPEGLDQKWISRQRIGVGHVRDELDKMMDAHG